MHDDIFISEIEKAQGPCVQQAGVAFGEYVWLISKVNVHIILDIETPIP